MKIDQNKREDEQTAGIPFNTNVLRIALNKQEEKIASTIIAFYNVIIDEAMLIRAIKTK